MADIIIHTGDVSIDGTEHEVLDFMEWFSSLDYKYKIFIAGNHDDYLEGKEKEIVQRLLPENCFYLYHSGITIEGIKFWGIPYFFSDNRDDRYPQLISKVPMDTDVLITHRPPLGILDALNNKNYGCSYLLQAVLRVRPRYHLFGHIHNAYGIEKSRYTTFANGSMTDEQYRLSNKPLHLYEISFNTFD